MRWAETLSAIARTGLAFAEPYDAERYEEVLAVAGDIIASASGSEAEAVPDLVEWWRSTVVPGVPGYVTPKVAVGAIVGNDAGEMLLIQRTDTLKWFLPTGWADVGYSLSEVVIKEVAEECGLVVEPTGIIAIYDSMRVAGPPPHHTVLFSCRYVSGDLRPHPLECADIGWFAEHSLPEPRFGGPPWVEWGFAALRGELVRAQFDAPRDPFWRPAPG